MLDRDAQMDNPCKWLSDALWDNITELDKYVIINNVTQDMFYIHVHVHVHVIIVFIIELHVIDLRL